MDDQKIPNKNQDQIASQVNTTKHKKKVIPTLFKLFQKIYNEEKLPNSYYVAIITKIPKQDKDTTKKDDRPFCLMNADAKNPQHIIIKPDSKIIRRIIHHHVGFILEIREWLNILKSIHLMYHINKMNNKNPMIILIEE